MTTIIRTSGTVFTESALPPVSPLVTKNLVGAYRPSNKLGGLFDLSGNGNGLTVTGNPTLTANMVQGDKNNGLVTGATVSTISVTLMAVVYIPVGLTPSESGFVVGNFEDGVAGDSIWISGKSIDGKYKAQLRAQSYYWRLSDTSLRNAVLTVDANINPLEEGKHYFVSYVLDEDARLSTLTLHLQDGTKGVAKVPYVLGEHSLADRPVKANPFEINSMRKPSPGTWPRILGVSESLIYDRALSDSEVEQQYQFSKQYFKKHANIDL